MLINGEIIYKTLSMDKLERKEEKSVSSLCSIYLNTFFFLFHWSLFYNFDVQLYLEVFSFVILDGTRI